MTTYPHDPLINSDYDKTYYGPAASGGQYNTSSGWSTSGYNTLNLNATGLNWINKSGETKFFLRSSRDISVTSPSGYEYVEYYSYEWGDGYRPQLVVTYTLPPPARKNLGVALAADWPNDWFTDLQNFADTLTNSQGWNQQFVSHDPSELWWREESNGGCDDTKADNNELSLIFSHSAVDGNGKTILGFGAGKGNATPSQVRSGYTSPDNNGFNIWDFAIECEVLNDASYTDWYSALTGEHMLLGFKTDANVSADDLQTLAYYLTGTGGKAKLNIQNAFFWTYLKNLDGNHANHLLNVCRILAQNSDVADNDAIDFFNPQISTAGTPIVITCNP